jgi:hypothetical protein
LRIEAAAAGRALRRKSNGMVRGAGGRFKMLTFGWGGWLRARWRVRSAFWLNGARMRPKNIVSAVSKY